MVLLAVSGPMRPIACDAAVFDCDVGTKPWIATAVDDACVSDEEIVGRRGSVRFDVELDKQKTAQR